MQQFLFDALIQGSPEGLSFVSSGGMCAYWEWGFWAGIVVGIIGAGVLFFTKAGDGV